MDVDCRVLDGEFLPRSSIEACLPKSIRSSIDGYIPMNDSPRLSQKASNYNQTEADRRAATHSHPPQFKERRTTAPSYFPIQQQGRLPQSLQLSP